MIVIIFNLKISSKRKLALKAATSYPKESLNDNRSLHVVDKQRMRTTWRACLLSTPHLNATEKPHNI